MNNKFKDILLILATMVVAFCMYGVANFYAPDETRYSEVAKEMLANHNFIVPYIDGMIFFHKPPLVYWITCIFMSIFGENTWGARLVNPVLLGICLIFTYITVRKVLDCRQTALLSVAVSLSTILFLFVGRYLNMDLAIAVFLNMTMLSYWVSLKYDDDYKKSTYWLTLAFIFAGLAVMTKGLMGIVFPMAIVGLYSVIMGQYKRLLDIRLYLGLVIVAVISLPWIFAVEQYHPNFAYYYIVVQQILRFSTDAQNREVSKIIYLLAIIGAFFPWTLFLPKILKSFFSKQAFKNRKQNSDKWFLFIWATFIFIFFGISKSFLFGYLAPLILPLSILVAIYFKSIDLQKFDKWDSISFKFIILIFALLPIVAVALLCLPQYWILGYKYFLILLAIAIIATVITIKLIKELSTFSVNKLVAYICIMMMTMANLGYVLGDYFDTSSKYKTAQEISKIYQKYPNAQVFESDRFYDIIFYTKRNVIIINDEGELDDVREFPKSNVDKYLMKFDKFVKYWNNSNQLNILVVKNKPKEHSPLAFDDYKKQLNPSKFYVISSQDNATIVASEDIKI